MPALITPPRLMPPPEPPMHGELMFADADTALFTPP
jgi:hypothetical protein